MCARMNHSPGNGEQERANDAVREHLQNCAGDTQRIRGREAEQDESHVADARVANDKFEIALAKRDRRRVDDPDDRQDNDPIAPRLKPFRENVERNTQRAISASFITMPASNIEPAVGAAT